MTAKADAGVELVAGVLVDLVTPSSVAVIGPGAREWADAFTAKGVARSVVLDDAPRRPFTMEGPVDLAVCVHGEVAVTSSAPALVASLVVAAPVVAFAAATPGTVDSDTVNERWPSWWDSLFADHARVPHDVVRPLVWFDDRVPLGVREDMVLYAEAGRFEPATLPPEAGRSVVHPDAHQRVLDLAAERLERATAAANSRLVALDRARTKAEEERDDARASLQIAMTEIGELKSSGPDHMSSLAEHLARVAGSAEERRRDVILLWAALAAREREIVALRSRALPSVDEVRSTPRRAVVRAVSGVVPLRRALPQVLGSSGALFDEHWYVARYPDVAASALSPLWHYRRHGARMGRAPNAFFDPTWYAERHPDVVASGLTPVEHYLRDGWRNGDDPHPLFSSAWYVEHHDLGRWRRSPLEHFLRHGRAAGWSPHPLIDPEWYLAENPELAAAGVNPVEHYLERGWWEGRSPHPLFDVRWYLETYPHVAYEGLEPLLEYLTLGWHDGRDPDPLFDTSWYLEQYPDVARAGVEPLTHYLMYGAAEGRATSPLFDTAWYVARYPDAGSTGRDPLTFYLTVGVTRGDEPSPWSPEGSPTISDP